MSVGQQNCKVFGYLRRDGSITAMQITMEDFIWSRLQNAKPTVYFYKTLSQKYPIFPALAYLVYNLS